tara:strand:+ start:1560 stop:2114 length:555 start_codon:yes stop_codon:yes gene_type:complete
MGIKVKAAIEIAAHVHRNQTRANGFEPFLNHPMRVAAIVENTFPMFSTEEVICAAILHDTLEDSEINQTPIIYEAIFKLCGSTVAAYVDMLSKPREKPQRSIRYMNTLSIAPQEVIVIKLADRIDNLNSMYMTNWTIPKMLNYIESSSQLYDIASSRGLSQQAQHLLLSIMIAESTIKAKLSRN